MLFFMHITVMYAYPIVYYKVTIMIKNMFQLQNCTIYQLRSNFENRSDFGHFWPQSSLDKYWTSKNFQTWSWSVSVRKFGENDISNKNVEILTHMTSWQHYLNININTQSQGGGLYICIVNIKYRRGGLTL